MIWIGLVFPVPAPGLFKDRRVASLLGNGYFGRSQQQPIFNLVLCPVRHAILGQAAQRIGRCSGLFRLSETRVFGAGAHRALLAGIAADNLLTAVIKVDNQVFENLSTGRPGLARAVGKELSAFSV